MSQGYITQTGNTQGADSSTDNAHPRFDGINGKILQDGKTIEDDNGIISSSQSAIAVRTTTAPSIPRATSTKVTFDTEDYDTQSEFDNTTNYRFTAKVAGKYLISSHARWGGNNISRNLLSVMKNGVEKARGEQTNTAGLFKATGVTCILDLAVGDYIEINVYQDNTALTSMTIGEDAYLYIHKLS